MPIADCKEVKLYYEIHGEGQPLLMIQGYGGSSEDWDQQEPRASDLAKHFKVVIFDNRGTGRSTAPPEGYTVKDMAARAPPDYNS